ncbi:hypothetical protein AMTRI_Chr11g101710 [Amborella trichopoda]
MTKVKKRKEEIAEDVCFLCKDGGVLLVCDYSACLKGYHTNCVGKSPDFLEGNEQWHCGWHFCYLCKRSSSFQCFCCPFSVCDGCFNETNFVPVKKKRGFCDYCLKLALMIEEDLDADSDGGKVDFNDTETYEYLFKDYWVGLKQKENIILENLQAAYDRLKKSKFIMDGKYSKDMLLKNRGEEDKEYKLDLESDGLSMEEKTKRKKMAPNSKKYGKKCKSGKMVFIGWGSKELISFLKSIGKDTEKPLDHVKVYEIVREYIHENKLVKPNKKSRILCDTRLRSLLGKKSLHRLRLCDSLERHLAASQKEESSSETSSDEDNPAASSKRKRLSDSCHETRRPGKNADEDLEIPKGVYARVSVKNIKYIYLRRSLLEKFYDNLETFESKVVGCFVRVKSDGKEKWNNYELVQVVGIKKSLEDLKVGMTSKDIALKVSNSEKDVPISLISDDEFSEEECEELRQSMKKGLLKRPTVEELQRKAEVLHEEITIHGIGKEIEMLRRIIARAKEKGVQQLSSPEEQKRQLRETPNIVADAEMDFEVVPVDRQGDNQNSVEVEKVAPGTEAPENAEPKEADPKNPNHDEKENVKTNSEEPKSVEQAPSSNIIDVESKEDYDGTEEEVWHYEAPKGTVQGPFSLSLMRTWSEKNLLPLDLKVWRTDQSPGDAVLLTCMLYQKPVPEIIEID